MSVVLDFFRKKTSPSIFSSYFDTKIIDEKGIFTFKYNRYKDTHSYNIYFQENSLSKSKLLVTRSSNNVFDLQKQFIEDYPAAERFLMPE